MKQLLRIGTLTLAAFLFVGISQQMVDPAANVSEFDAHWKKYTVPENHACHEACYRAKQEAASAIKAIPNKAHGAFIGPLTEQQIKAKALKEEKERIQKYYPTFINWIVFFGVLTTVNSYRKRMEYANMFRFLIPFVAYYSSVGAVQLIRYFS